MGPRDVCILLMLIWVAWRQHKILKKLNAKAEVPSAPVQEPKQVQEPPRKTPKRTVAKNDGVEHMSAREYREMMGLPISDEN